MLHWKKSCCDDAIWLQTMNLIWTSVLILRLAPYITMWWIHAC